MKKGLSMCLASILLASTAMGLAGCGTPAPDVDGASFSSPDVSLDVYGAPDTDNAQNEISKSLFGVFLEDINYASYAMDDNMIANGSFESIQQSKDRMWDTKSATITPSTDGAICGTSPTYAKVTVNVANGGITNKGYDACPIAVTEGVKYVYSAFVKAPSYSGKMKVSILDKDEKTVAEGEIQVSNPADWTKYVIEITANKTVSDKVTCFISFDTVGEVLLDGISFETTDSTVGIKNYIYEAIKDLSPSFVRFPGGCIIEGRKADDSPYDWKNSIGVGADGKATELTYNQVTAKGSEQVTTTGEAVTRKHNLDLWVGATYYDMEYNLGFYDYFVMCDSIGASAVPIVNCGLSCMGGLGDGGQELPGRNGNGIQDFIQDALDLVAFAKGDVNSSDKNEAYWAGVRAAMGHAEPFEMDYLGIGNEQFGDKYYNYYQQFLVAFANAAKTNDLYATVTPIVGNGMFFSNTEDESGNGGTARAAARQYLNAGGISTLSEYGVHDHHYYMNYHEFFANVHHYDNYSRKEDTRYDVFVGEYSANEVGSNYSPYTSERNAWITALSEAAYMTGLERNGDVVKLAAYAPMFGAANFTNNWAVDMMYYTNTQLVRSANYYVQQAFAQNVGDWLLESELDFDDEKLEKYTLVAAGDSTRTTVIDSVFQVASYDEETGDVIVKLVNASETDMKLNIFLNDVTAKGNADVYELQCSDRNATNTVRGENVTPKKYTLGVSKTTGFALQASSVAIIRIHTK